MKRTALYLVLLCFSLSLFAQNPAASDQQKSAPPRAEAPKGQAPDPNKPTPITEPNLCKAYRIGDPKGEGCVRTCDTGQMAQCISVALDSPTPPVCNCVKAQGLEGVNPFSMCHAVRKDAEGHEWERCNIACDKRTVVRCADAPMYPTPGAPSCRCEPKAAPKKT